MVRRIIEIDRDKCNGCGACAEACHEGAIAMVDGKAQLMRDDYCDGLGDCLPTCPTGAITFVEREAAAYDEKAVMENKQRKMREQGMTLPCGCPGSQSRNIQRETAPAAEAPRAEQASRLSQWPVQIKLVPVNAPYFDGARLLIAADCTAYAYAAFHERFIKGHITLVGCPKLDSGDYAEKLTEIIRENDIKSVTVVRMEVPCCGGLEMAAKKALQQSGKFIPWQVVTVTVDGQPATAEGSLYTLPADNVSHEIVAVDVAGNRTAVTVSVYRIYTVTPPTGTGFTFTGETTVRHGQDYRFRVDIAPGYSKLPDYSLLVNGQTPRRHGRCGLRRVPDPQRGGRPDHHRHRRGGYHPAGGGADHRRESLPPVPEHRHLRPVLQEHPDRDGNGLRPGQRRGHGGMDAV